MLDTLDWTVRDIVVDDYRAAAVFERYGINFCCNADRTVDEACREVGVPVTLVAEALAAATRTPDACVPRFKTWDLASLISYIVSRHNRYVRNAVPRLLQCTRAVAGLHGRAHPEVVEVAAIFDGLSWDLLAHVEKEEQVIFPAVARLDAPRRDAGEPAVPKPGTVTAPLPLLQREHESVARAMTRINELTYGYVTPGDACATYRVMLEELAAFERDLHTHVHLENNILFPKAVEVAARTPGSQA